jgi:pimeloyl-ACP methyl ester carboxylesterase
VLTAARENGPVVLVAHSWGGPVIRVFADRHPVRIAGVVLVDSSLAEFTATPRQVMLGKTSFRISALLIRLGGASAVTRMALPHGRAPELSDADMRIITRDYASVRAMRTGVREAQQVLAARATLERLELAGLPDVPVVVLQGGREERSRSARRFRHAFNTAAGALIARQPRARITVVNDAGHLIPQEQPAAVVDAILEVVALAP